MRSKAYVQYRDVWCVHVYTMISDWHCTKYAPDQGKYLCLKFIEIKPATHVIKN